MGKRKYKSDDKGNTKKNKTEDNETETSEQPQNEGSIIENKDTEENTEKNHSYDVKHFRKELTAKQGQTIALTQFLQVCLNPDSDKDYMLEYLKIGGNSHEILRQIGQDNKKNLTLATPAFHLFHLAILKVQSSLPHMITITEEACRYFLNTFMQTVEIMISENSGPRHRKIVLKLLTSMVTLNPDLGVEVLNQAPLTPKHLQYIVEKVNYKEKDNVRTAFVYFMTSFLVDGHLPLIKALLEKQGLLPLVIPGLVHDEAEAILMFLSILKKNVVDNQLISKSLKLRTFSHQVLHNIFKLFAWKGPPELSHELKNISKPEVLGLVSNIILTLFTSHKVGLYFVDNSLGTSDANKNQNLYKALLTLKRPWEYDIQCELLLEIVWRCPDLHRAIINIIEQCFEPQHTPIWEKVVTFVMKLLDKLKPEDMVQRMTSLKPLQVANIVRFTTLPVPLLKSIHTSLGKNDHIISLHCIQILVKMLSTLKRYIHILEMSNHQINITDLKNRLEAFFPKHLPVASTIVSLINKILKGIEQIETTQEYHLTKPDDADALISLIDLLLLYHDLHPVFFEGLEGSLDMKNILEFSSNLTNGNVSMLKFKIVSLWLTLDSSAISLKNSMFKDLFLIMLEVYTNEDNDTWIEAKDTMWKFFKNTAIFEADEDEIHIMLYTLRNAKIQPSSIIADIVEYVLENHKQLSEYIRNQIVHFEIADENSQANLDKLFDDLLADRSTEDSTFLEYKIPSPFIVGCIQYVQANKEIKKNLKHFLSLYIANLLHYNYCPELTEVLIGDLKLDVRNYVASWIGEPVALSESSTNKDSTIRKLGKSIIDREDIEVSDIFPFVRITTFEENDFLIMDVPLKINSSVVIDSSELLIWAKYLVFCVIRLAKMSQLHEAQQKKILFYFEIIIAIGQRYHMTDICRDVIGGLMKNAHALNIYSSINQGKDELNPVATNFILEIITRHQDILKYLNSKHNVLQPFQRKNYNELVKTLIKIKKKKNIDNAHTVKVLELIGMSHEDCLNIMHKIFEIDVANLIIDDKEPSIAFEILRVLIAKYSKSLDMDLPEDIFKNIIKVYTTILANCESNPNISNFETTLLDNIECKPYQAKLINADDFKHFFYTNLIRKSTSQLASSILKYNGTLCDVFKEQLNRKEILSQREITLPLGNSIIHHSQFIDANKELLLIIWGDYKFNIMKLLEKPNKAGPIYIANCKFIQKLILECAQIEDCIKIFNKQHKFDMLEKTHIILMQALFLKLCSFTEAHKKEYLINYFIDMLHLITYAIKEGKDIVINLLISNIYNVAQIVRSLKGFDVKEKANFDKLVESAIWQNFGKAVLKNSLKVRTTTDQNSNGIGPKLLSLLTNLVKLFYPFNHADIVTLFDMVTSHSEFLNVMLSHHSSDIKSRLIEFLYVLILRNKSVMKGQQIPVYLSSYHATRSPCDRLILTILHFYETNGQPVHEYKPYVWGDSAANYYSVRKNRSSSLWGHPTPNQILNLLEKEVIEKTVQKFPVTQKLDYHFELSPNINVTKDPIPFDNSVKTLLDKITIDGLLETVDMKDSEARINSLILKCKYERSIKKLQDCDLDSLSHNDGSTEEEDIYDPAFLFSLLSHLLAPGSVASSFKVLRSGLLSIPVMALSSHCPSMRAAAYHVIHRFYLQLETETRYKNDKLLLTDFVDTLRQSLTTAIVTAQKEKDAIKNLNNPRLPAVDALYLARTLMVSTAPFHPLYKPVNNFLIAKQHVDLTVVPDFLSLFHDGDVEAAERRIWLLEVIRDGTKTMTDVNVVFKTMCLKMLMDFYSSVVCERKVKERILGVLGSLTAIPRAAEILIEGYGLISWLHYIMRNLRIDEKNLVKHCLVLLKNLLYSFAVSSFAKNIGAGRKNAKANKNVDEFGELTVNKGLENEILSILCDLLRFSSVLDEEDTVLLIHIYSLLSKKVLTKNHLVNVINSINVDGELNKVLLKAIFTNDSSVLRSKFIKDFVENENNNIVKRDIAQKLVTIVKRNLL